MGREVRRVPPNWEHPKKDCTHNPWAGGCSQARFSDGKCFHPLYDRDFESAMQEWLDGLEKWKVTEFAEHLAKYPNETPDGVYRAFCEWNGTSPDPEYYRPSWTEGEATRYQLYETVSEGTPVSPPFETQEELARYLAENGDYWYQNDTKEGRETFRSKPTLEQARSLVDTGWAMSLMVERSSEGVKVMDAYQQQDIKNAL